MIERQRYLNELIRKKENGLVKVITGIRRCGKSYLLNEIFYDYLIKNKVKKNHIITIALDDIDNIKYRNPIELNNYIVGNLKDKGMYYVFIDEIQECKTIDNPYLDYNKITFIDTLLGLAKRNNVDLYVTGSNSKMLSEDILTEFRGKADEVKVMPLTYKEFYDAYKKDKANAYKEYMTYGGMPFVMSLETHKEKTDYLNGLFKKIYFADIIERNHLQDKQLIILENLMNMVASSIGSLTNPLGFEKLFVDRLKIKTTNDTISNYLNYFEDAFLIKQVRRYDIKGKEYIGSPYKYYFMDMGLRNAMLNFRQMDEPHIMENVIYNELIARGYSVDVGYMQLNERKDGKNIRVMKEVDFVVSTSGSERYYIQSAFKIDNDDKKKSELKVYTAINDSFKKIVIEKEILTPYYDENGIYHIGLEDFILKDNVFE